MGIVSGDLLFVKTGSNEQESNSVGSSNKTEEKMDISQPSTSTEIIEPMQIEDNVSLIELDKVLDLIQEHVQNLGFEVTIIF